MGDLTFRAIAEPWWPYLFILLAGWLPTDIWRFIGVFSAGRIDENSPLIELVRAVATALVAAVIARIVIYPDGSLATIPLAVRVGALASGFLVYLLVKRSVVVAILVAEAILLAAPLALRLV